ncbi:hypothetical protein BD410DRAFT_791970 [Rickenella mellea]|uniref:Uncharacterized protein n=1 Tax=Rickenella mellea TaxID=50990 RepID=A0A4Y7PTE6_9AGAM|nr:hypothetical protein BD410DRAFT_793373 [Rickenella mellea]TDL19583.1 hypothetical protein BD410DRAFT_791970 [Rickenella mellea]
MCVLTVVVAAVLEGMVERSLELRDNIDLTRPQQRTRFHRHPRTLGVPSRERDAINTASEGPGSDSERSLTEGNLQARRQCFGVIQLGGMASKGPLK